MKTLRRKMIAVLLALTLLACASPATGFPVLLASAEYFSGTCGVDGSNLNWWINTETGLLRIYGRGEMADGMPWDDYRDLVRAVSIGNGVESIGSNAFEGCMNLTEVSIPDSVWQIGDFAFSDCPALTHVHIPSRTAEIGLRVFDGCSNLFYICSDTESSYAKQYAEGYRIEFRLCSGHADLIPQTVYGICGAQGTNLTWTLDTQTGEMTIDGTGEMADFRYEDDDMPWFEYKDLIRSVEIGENVTGIGDFAFFDFPNLTNVTIGSGVTHIGMGAFCGAALTDIYIPCNVQQIEMGALVCGLLSSYTPTLQSIGIDPDNAYFRVQDGALYDSTQTVLVQYPNADARTSFAIPDGVRQIAAGAFAACRNLTDIAVPDSVSEIGQYAFAYSTNLTGFTIPDGVTDIQNSTFESCVSLARVTIPDSVTIIGSWSFSRCSGLAQITIPADVTDIRYYAFGNCTSLTNIRVPDKVASIGGRAFCGCTNLESVHIPSAVAEIRDDAFAECSSLAYLCSDSADGLAKTYAEENQIEFRLCDGHSEQTRVAGDTNGDGILNLKDVVLMRRYLAGGWNVTLDEAAGDVDGDGSLTLQDVVLARRYLSGGWDVVLQ